jgi:hypothetical protein
MCKRIVLMLAVLIGGAAVPGNAQDRDVAKQRALIDSLLPELAAARREMLRADSLVRAMQVTEVNDPLDTAVVQPFTIIAPRGQAAETFALIREAVRRAPHLFGSLPPDPRLVIGIEWQAAPHRGLQALARRSNIRMASLYGGSRSARARGGSADAAVANALLPLMPDSVRVWLQDQDWSRGRETDRVHRHLATSPSPYAQRCFRYDVEGCNRAMGLVSVDSLQGYTLEQIRLLAAQRINRQEHTAFWRSCVDAKSSASCLLFMQRTGGLPPAVPPFGRANFLMYVLERGGAGAFARLIAPQHPNARAAIVAAGNAPLPELVGGWRRSIDDNREHSYAGLPKAVIAVLIWTTIAALLAMSSTRRRAE